MRTRAVRDLMVAGMMGAMVVGGVAPASASTNDPSCFVAAINAARGSAGVASLATNAALALIAQTWSGSMAAVGQISHNLNLPNLAPSNWIALGENVGVGPSCDSLAQAFMNSPEHKANIMNPAYSSVGVGTVITADGTLYVTEDFMGTGSPAPAPAPKPAPAPVIPPAPAPTHTTPPAPAPAPVPAVVHTTAPAPKPAAPPAPRPAPVTPAAPPPAPVTPPAPAPAPVPNASPATDPAVTPAADPIVLMEAPAKPAVKAAPGRGGAGRTAQASHTNHGHHHRGGVLHAIGSLLAHLF